MRQEAFIQLMCINVIIGMIICSLIITSNVIIGYTEMFCNEISLGGAKTISNILTLLFSLILTPHQLRASFVRTDMTTIPVEVVEEVDYENRTVTFKSIGKSITLEMSDDFEVKENYKGRKAGIKHEYIKFDFLLLDIPIIDKLLYEDAENKFIKSKYSIYFLEYSGM